jgi:antirestriction protein ArdC
MAKYNNSGDRVSIYTKVTNQIIEALEQADLGKFSLPWYVGKGGLAPLNVSTEKHYRGINTLALWVSQQMNSYNSNVWGTYKHWSELGAQVRKGEKGTSIVFFQPLEPGDKAEGEQEEGGKRNRFIAKGYSVFCADQVDGFDMVPVRVTSELQRIEHAEEFISNLGARIEHGGSRAYYSPSSDHIQMPPLSSFSEIIPYYATLLHEAVHWSGGKGRLDRDMSGRFKSESYAAEELVAELGAAFLCSSIGVSAELRLDHAQYISGWLKILKGDERAIFTAASMAQKAADYLHGLQPEITDISDMVEDEGVGEGPFSPHIPQRPTLIDDQIPF